MSQKKGQKHLYGQKPMNLKELSLLPKERLRKIAKKIELKSGSKVWWDECPPEEELKGMPNTLSIHSYDGLHPAPPNRRGKRNPKA